MNEILLRRKNKVIVQRAVESEQERCKGDSYVATIMKNVETLGYTFSWKLFETLRAMEISELQEFYLELVPILKKMVGANVVYEPMYPDFPKSVMEADETRLYINAIVHYWSFGTLYPDEHKSQRLPLFDAVKLKVIDLGSMEDFQSIFYNLCCSQTSLSQTDKEDLAWMFGHLKVKFPEEIPLKENAALLGNLYLKNDPLASSKELEKFCKTATDVLRLITSMSNGDVSLRENTKYKSFSRRERRLLMELLQNCSSVEEDMLRYQERWVRIGEKLHPGEYDRERFERVITAFDKLRNHTKIETFAGRVENAIATGDYSAALDLLKKRPGELARRLDWLLRKTEDKNAVVNAFKTVADEVSTPVLLQVREHFLHRGDAEPQAEEVRVFFPKGNLARSHCIANTLPDIEEKYCRAMVGVCENALIENYGKKDFLGNVYLSPEFKNFLVPFSQRSASKTLKTIVRGSKLPIASDVNALRAFIWWTNMGTPKETEKTETAGRDVSIGEEDGTASTGAGDETTSVNVAEGTTSTDAAISALAEQQRVDLDLSAAIFDENWNCLEHVSYTNLRSDKYRACHSGDIVNGGPVDGPGASEFLDVDIESVLQYGGRYVVYQVYSFTMQKFSWMPHAMFGWMGRNDVGSGEIYEPVTVEQKMDLASDGIVCIPVIFDCLQREMIWCDMNLGIQGCWASQEVNNLENNLKGVAATCYGVIHMNKPNLYDLIDLHIKARGVQVEDKEEADIIFDVTEGITPFDIDVFMGEYI